MNTSSVKNVRRNQLSWVQKINSYSHILQW